MKENTKMERAPAADWYDDGYDVAVPYTTWPKFPPTNLHATDAPNALRFYAERFKTGETKRWDLAAHLLEHAAEIIEKERTNDLTNL